MATVKVTPAVTPGDRLGMMLFLGAMLHGLIILGISFTIPEPAKTPPSPTLDIILVQSKSAKAPEEADYLAQANQDGGGTVDKKSHLSKPVQGPSLTPNTSINKHIPKLAKSPESKPIKKKVITSKKGKNFVLSKPDKKPTRKRQNLADTQQLISRSLEIASLTAEISKKITNYANRPRKKHISARTREFAPAAYMNAWTRKVERIGNLNYPDEARRQRLSGRLRLTVAINKDGSLREIKVNQASGHQILDDSAIRIVKLGAPYARIPDNIKEAGDPVEILYITRTWEFSSSGAWRDRGGG
jgi:protein TonB